MLGQQTLALERNPERPARSATLTVRGLQVTIEVPRQHKQPKPCQAVVLKVLWVEEVTPPAEGKPMR